MKKYKVIKDFCMPEGMNFNIDEEVTFTDERLLNYFLDEKYIKLIDKQIVPKWKIGDKICISGGRNLEYTIIDKITIIDNETIFYNKDELDANFWEFREPNEEELRLYYN